MAMERWIEGQQKLGNKAAVAMGENLRREFGEVPLEAAVSPSAKVVESTAPRIEIKPPLAQAIKEYKKTRTPELITAFNTVLWDQITQISGVDVSVPAYPGIEQQIKEMEARDKGLIFIPEQYAEQAQRPLVAAAFKLLGNEYVPNNWSMQPDNPVKNDIIHVGYRFVDMQIEAPNLRTNEKQARDLMGRGKQEEGSEGMNLSEYALAGLYSKLLTGQYLDEGTWSRLLSSSDGGRVVRAGFYSHGDFDVDSGLGPEDRDDDLGARFSSGVKTA